MLFLYINAGPSIVAMSRDWKQPITHFVVNPRSLYACLCPCSMYARVDDLLHPTNMNASQQWQGMLLSSALYVPPAARICMLQRPPPLEDQHSCYDAALLQAVLACACLVPVSYLSRRFVISRHEINEQPLTSGCISMLGWPCSLAQIEAEVTSTGYDDVESL